MRRALLLSLACLACACEPRITSVGAWSDSGHFLEAELGALSGGFEAVTDATASGGVYLSVPEGMQSEDEPGEARAVYEIDVRTPGTYRIYGRIRAADASHNRTWIRVDEGEWYKWRISAGDIWYWDALHDNTRYGVPLEFELAAGRHRLTLANCADQVQVDRLYFTAVEGDEPLNETRCNPPHSIEVGGTCLPSCGSQGGNQCGTVCQGHSPMFAYDCGPLCCRIAP